MQRSLLVFIFTFMAWVAYAENSVAVAVIDMAKAMQSTNDGKKAKALLEDEFNKLKKDLEKLEKQLGQKREELEKKKALVSAEAFSQQQDNFQQEVLKFRERMQKSEAELQKKQASLTDPILEKMKKAITRVASEKQISVVIDLNERILYFNKTVDITEDVLKAYEKPS